MHKRVCFWMLWLSLAGVWPAAAQQAELVEIFADRQQRSKETYILRGNVELRYRGLTLRADEVTYNETSGEVEARGNVEFARENELVGASEGTYNLRTGRGRFANVRGTVTVRPRPQPDLLLSPNPFYFEAQWVERHPDGTYVAHHGWVTNCTPEHARWKLKAKRVDIRPGQRVTLHRSTFVLASVPILYAPYFTHSLQERPRQSGFLLPAVGNNSRKGASISEGFFWAINPHADLELGADYYSLRGWGRRARLRVLPTATSSVHLDYFGVSDRGQRLPGGRRGLKQSGDFAQLVIQGELGRGFRSVVDFTHLSSFLFRLGFTETFSEAVVSEVHADAFITNNPDTYYFNGFFGRYRNFLTVLPETAVTLLNAPGVEFGTRPRLFGRLKLPLYLSLDTSLAGVRRSEPRFETPALVQRFDLYPRVTLPLLRSPYLRLTPSFGFRATRYGARLLDDPSAPGGKRVLSQPLRRITEEVSVDLRPPALTRIYDRGQHRYKHVVEPQVVYRYVTGVGNFGEILRFDSTDILTDTHEVEYSVTNRFWRKARQPGTEPVQEFFSWRLAQKYFFDPTLGGALLPGRRNVVAALASLTGFAFADGPRRFSPIISTMKVTPGRQYDTEWRLDLDPTQGKIVNSRLTVSALLWRALRGSLTHFLTRNHTVLQPRAHQMGAVFSWGGLNQRGLNLAGAFYWNIRKHFFQNQVIQVSYNWDCCGVAFEYRRLGLGPLRSENQFRFAFFVANVGTFGTLRKQERLF